MLRSLSVRAHNLLTLGLILLTVLGAVYAVRPRPIRISGTALEFVALGEVDPGLMRGIARETSGVYHVPYSVAARPVALPAAAYDRVRGQYDTVRLRQWFRRLPIGQGVHRIGITSSDITAKGFNFLLGQADLPGQICVMSTYRLYPMNHRRAISEATLTSRAVCIAVHELGHTYGFHHCPNEPCVMSFSDTAGDLDEWDATFCPRCRPRIR